MSGPPPSPGQPEPHPGGQPGVQPETPPPATPRMVLTIRVRPESVEDLDRIAAYLTETTGTKHTRSDVHRLALKEFVLRHYKATQGRRRT